MPRSRCRHTTLGAGLALAVLAAVATSAAHAADREAAGRSVCAGVKKKPGHAPQGKRDAAAKHGRRVGKLKIYEVSAHVTATQGGAAHRTIFATGLVVGGHLSGGSKSPRVFEEHGQASRACVDAVWKAAAEVALSGQAKEEPTAASGATELSVRLAGKSLSVTWTSGSRPADARVARLWELLGALAVGGW